MLDQTLWKQYLITGLITILCGGALVVGFKCASLVIVFIAALIGGNSVSIETTSSGLKVTPVPQSSPALEDRK